MKNLLISAVSACVALSAAAETNVWTSGSIGRATDWSLGHEPANGEDILIALPSDKTGCWEYNPGAAGYTLGTASLASFTLRHDGTAQPRQWNPVKAPDAIFELPNSSLMWFSGRPVIGSGTLSIFVPNGTTLFDAAMSDFTGDVVISNRSTKFTAASTVGAAGRKATFCLTSADTERPITAEALTFPGAVDFVQIPEAKTVATRFTFGGGTAFNGPVEIKNATVATYFEGGPLTFNGGIRNVSAKTVYVGPGEWTGITNVITGGMVDLAGTFYVCNSALRLSAPVKAQKVTAGYYTLALVCEADNLFDNVTDGIEIGVGWAPVTADIVLKGTRQKFNVLKVNTNTTVAFKGEGASTLEIADASDATYSGGLKGDLSVVHSGTGSWKLTGAANDMNGIIKVTAGTVTLTAASRFPNLSGIEVTGNGRLVVEDAASIPASLATLRVTGGGHLKLPDGLNLTIDRAVIGPYALEPETYSFATYSEWVTGGGSFVVREEPIPEPGETYTWTGKGDNDAIETSENWDRPPVFNRSAQLVFGEAAKTTVTVNSEIRAYSVTFSGAEDYTVASGSADGKLMICKTLATTASGHTVTISAPIQVPNNDCEWNVASETVLQLDGAISGGQTKCEIWQRGEGEMKLAGDNRNLLSQLIVTNGMTWAQHEWALGSDQRPFMFYGDATEAEYTARGGQYKTCYLRFDPESHAATRLGGDTPLVMTNYTPVSFCGFPGVLVPHRSGTANPGHTVVFMKPLCKVPGGYSGNMVLSRWYSTLSLDGGFQSDSEDTAKFTENGGYLNFNGQLSGKHMTLVGVSPNTRLGATGDSALGTLNLMYDTAQVTCDGLFADCATPPILLLGASWNVSNVATLDLDGHDATFRHLETQQDNTGVISSPVGKPAFVRLADSADWRGAVVMAKFTGEAGLVLSGPGLQRFDIASDTAAPLIVENGSVLFVGDGGWQGSTNVIVRGTGAINVKYKKAGTVFSSDAVTSQVSLFVEGDGRLDLGGDGCSANAVAGLALGTEIVKRLYVNGKGMAAGDYTKSNCSFVKSGTLRVLRSTDQGIAIIVR